MPDGACADEDGGVWSCLLAAGAVVRYTAHGLDSKVQAGVELPSDSYRADRTARRDRPERIFDAVRAVIAETGVLKGRTRRALDSTVLDDAVATQDTVTQLIAAVRRVRRLVPAAAALELAAHDYADPAKPSIAWDDAGARQTLISALVTDALSVLDAMEGLTLDADAIDAVGLLALVAGQDVEPGDVEGTWYIAEGTTPDRVISTVDPDSRHIHKTVAEYRDGYKAHIAVEPDTGLVTAGALTPGNVADGDAATELVASEPAGLEVYADSAYGSGETRAALRRAGHDPVIKPMPVRGGIPGGFDRDDFVVDHHGRRVTCPAGQTVAIRPSGTATFGVRCRGCPLRSRCTTAKKGKTLRITDHDDELVFARLAWRDPVFFDHYRQHRPMVERTIAWLVAHGHRRVRYRGVGRNQFWLSTRLAALNLRRMINLGLCRGAEGWAIA